MAKFVKLENGNYINIDKIITISNPVCDGVVYAYTMGVDSDWKAHSEKLTVTDLENILKASE